MKGGSRIAAFDESFSGNDKEGIVIGIIGRRGVVEGAISFNVSVDGNDATSKLISSIKKSRFNSQVRLIALNGITFTGLNIIDIAALRDKLHLPIIAITRHRPRRSLLRLAMKKRGSKEGIAIFERIAPVISIRKSSAYYVQTISDDYDRSKALIDEAASLLRLAHIVASGIRHGESRGRL